MGLTPRCELATLRPCKERNGMGKVRQPQQDRSIKTRAAIMNAAFALFAEKGIHGTNSKEIVKKAGVSIGSFYAYFKNKKTLLLEMLEDYLDRHYTAIWGEVNSSPPEKWGEEEVRSLVRHVFRAYDISPEFHRQTHALRYSDPDINEVYERDRERQVAQLESLIITFKDLLHIKDARASALIIHNSVENAAHTAKFIGHRMEEERLINALTNMIYQFIKPR